MICTIWWTLETGSFEECVLMDFSGCQQSALPDSAKEGLVTQRGGNHHSILALGVAALRQ